MSTTDLVLTTAEQAAVLAARRAAGGGPALTPVLQQLLTPSTPGALDATAAPAPVAAQVVPRVGTVAYKLYNPHSLQSAYYPTQEAAEAAALREMETKHTGCLANPDNPTKVEIIPVLQVGVKDVLAARAAAIPTTAEG